MVTNSWAPALAVSLALIAAEPMSEWDLGNQIVVPCTCLLARTHRGRADATTAFVTAAVCTRTLTTFPATIQCPKSPLPPTSHLHFSVLNLFFSTLLLQQISFYISLYFFAIFCIKDLEIMKATLKKAWLEDFYGFVLAQGGTTEEVNKKQNKK